MIHQVKLSNGQILLVEESETGIHIGLGEKQGYVDTSGVVHDPEFDAYICQITRDGVLTYGNSGDACEILNLVDFKNAN
jgi:hypothetical protein